MKKTLRAVAAGAFTVYDREYSPRFSIPWHQHRTAEFCFVVSGGVTEVVGGTTLRCRPHDLSLKQAGESHRVAIPNRGARLLIVSIPDDRAAGRAGLAAVGNRVYSHPDLTGLGVRAFRELEAGDDFSPLVLESLALLMVAHAGRSHPRPLPVGAPGWLQPVLERLHDAPGGRVSLAELASLGGVSLTYLAATFQRVHRCTVGDYIRRLQVERAIRLLSTGLDPLSQIAKTCGFSDQSHFSRVFRRYVGVSPARFRRGATR